MSRRRRSSRCSPTVIRKSSGLKSSRGFLSVSVSVSLTVRRPRIGRVCEKTKAADAATNCVRRFNEGKVSSLFELGLAPVDVDLFELFEHPRHGGFDLLRLRLPVRLGLEETAGL